MGEMTISRKFNLFVPDYYLPWGTAKAPDEVPGGGLGFLAGRRLLAISLRALTTWLKFGRPYGDSCKSHNRWVSIKCKTSMWLSAKRGFRTSRTHVHRTFIYYSASKVQFYQVQLYLTIATDCFNCVQMTLITKSCESHFGVYLNSHEWVCCERW